MQFSKVRLRTSLLDEDNVWDQVLCIRREGQGGESQVLCF